MSIAVLTQVYDEARRLAVAGSVVARGDFRLKKLLPPLEQAGAKSPVFAKVAECAKAVIDGSEEQSAENLLELSSLVTAVLYTQGETGMPGTLEPIETVNLGGTSSQISARDLKPLLMALRTIGSERLELVKEAAERGYFRDLRLVNPALDALDDPYPELAIYLEETVLPSYGTALLPILRAKFDIKGTKGHPRRLRLMHALDPVGTRELVTQALDGGSKEVKVAAISCLGANKEDLAFLIEQAGAKAQDVRSAAYRALASTGDPAAIAAIEKALAGKELEMVARAVHHRQSSAVTERLVARIREESATLMQEKDKKKVGTTATRLIQLIRVLPSEPHGVADTLTLELFARRAELAKVKGDMQSGSDVAEAVIGRMAHTGPIALKVILARAHAELDADGLSHAIQAARSALPAAEVYDLYSAYLLAPTGDKKKGKDAAEKKAAIIEMLGGDQIRWYHHHRDAKRLDPRWLDLAVKIEHLGLIHAAGRPGHTGAEAFVQATFDAKFKKAKQQTELDDVLTTMVHLQHPKAAESLIASYSKTIGKANAYTHWYYHLIGELPQSAIPLLEAVVPKLKDPELDRWIDAIQTLKEKQ